MAAVWNFIRSLHWAAQLAILAFVVWVIYMIYTWASEKITGVARKEDVDPQNIPLYGEGENGEQVYWDPDELASDLYTCMKGANLYACNNYWDEITDLQTDDQVRLLYNHFNENYGEGYSLVEWINSQYAIGDASTSKNNALARLNKALKKN